jgi:peptide/nickel transport system permease protein
MDTRPSNPETPETKTLLTKGNISTIIFKNHLLSAGKILVFLIKKALILLVTIFIGVFLTIVIVNRPVTLGFVTKQPQFETSLQKQINLAIQDYKNNTPSFLNLSPAEQEGVVEDLRNSLTLDAGLNLSYLPRHLYWTIKALIFDWGELKQIRLAQLPMLGRTAYSLSTNDIIENHLPNTILLAVTANLFIFLLGLPISLWLSQKYDHWLDRVFVLLAPIFSIPSWVIGIILIAIFAVGLKILPFGGMLDTLPPEQPIGYIPIVAKHMVLPVLAIFLSMFFQVVYAWRTYFLIDAEEDYVVLGRAIGLPQKILQRQYILKPSFPYILTSFSMLLVSFWQMTMALEVIFRWPGVGWLFVTVGLPNFWGESMYPGEMIIAVSLIAVFAYLLSMVVFLLDLIYVIVDPRVHLQKKEPALRHKRIFQSENKREKKNLLSFLSVSKSTANNRSNILPTHPSKVIVSWQPGDQKRFKKPHLSSMINDWKRLLGMWDKLITNAKSAFLIIWRYPSALMGLMIILLLVIGSLYSILFLPFEKIGAEWKGSTMTGQALVPKLAKPGWINLLNKGDYLSTIILDSKQDQASKVEGVFVENNKSITITYTFNYNYMDFPEEIYLYLDGEFSEKKPYTDITWITPDGREIKLKGTSAPPGTTYNFADNIAAPRFIRENPLWQNWFRFGQIFPTPSFYVLFADPNSDQPKVIEGQYTLRLDGIAFEEQTDLDAKLVLLGQVYGLAGTDNLRRDLVLPLLWGMPIALGFGLAGALITTLVSMIISAAGVWYGGWMDSLIQRLTEINLSLPILAISVLAYAYLGVNLWIVLLIIIFLNIFGSPTKNFRSSFLILKNAPYIEAARSYGASNIRIIMRYLVPRILPTMVPQLVILIPSFVFLEVTLGLFNINTGYPTWGTIIYQAISEGALYSNQYRILQPLALVLLTGMSFSLFGFSLERILNPRLMK